MRAGTRAASSRSRLRFAARAGRSRPSTRSSSWTPRSAGSTRSVCSRTRAAERPGRGRSAAAKRRPGLLAGDVDEAVALVAERRPDHDLEVCRLVSLVERRVDDVLVDVDGVADAELRGLALEVLRDAPRLDDDHLL